MKHIAKLLVLLLLAACHSEAIQNDILRQQRNDNKLSIRSAEEAQACALAAVDMFGSGTKAHKKTIASSKCVTRLKTKSEPSNEVDTLCYVFNYSDNEGFAVISANKRIDPFICVTESGSYDAGIPTGVEGFDHYMNDVLEFLGGIGPCPDPHHDDSLHLSSYTVNRYDGAFVLPLLETEWGQQEVYGAYCPNGISGCVATAMAQIMVYHAHPSIITLSTNMGPYSSGDMLSVHWDNIKYHQTGHTGALACTNYHSEISALLRDIGNMVNMNYGPTSSGASSSYVPGAFSYYGYLCDDLYSVSIPSVIFSLNLHRPVYMRGAQDYGGGHAWVADGYKDYVLYQDVYIHLNGHYVLYESNVIEEVHALHINWGWNGLCNGYFNFGVYDTANAISYDGISGVEYTFDNNVQMIANIRKNI